MYRGSMNFSSCYETSVTRVMMGWQILLLLIGLCTLQLGLAESDLQIILNSVDVEGNEEYIQDCKIDVCDNDEMLPKMKIKCDIVKSIPSDAMLKINLSGMVNGEPTDPTGIEMEMNVCQMVHDTSFVGVFVRLLKIPQECPIQPITIDVDCFFMPLDALPDFIPSGDYQFNVIIDHNDVNLFSMETLRIYPLVMYLVRGSLKDYTFNGTNVTISKGTKVFIPIYGIQHDPDIYPDPEVFDPDRFTDEVTKSRHPMHSLSFGNGPRKCIGLRFAYLQMKIGLITVLNNYVIDVCEETPTLPYPLNMQNVMMLQPTCGMYVKLSPIIAS